MTLNVERLAARFADAVAEAEVSTTLLNQDRRNERLIHRHLRNLRKCDRLRQELAEAVEKGKL